MSEIPTLTTVQLTLRPIVAGDALPLHRIYQSEGVLQYFPNTTPPPLEKLERFTAFQQRHWEQYGYGNWGVVPNGMQEIIGWAGLQFLSELDETEVGFLLDRPFWGRGYATEAAQAAMQFGFEVCGLEALIALVHPENGASQRVIAKCGMAYQETIALWGIELRRYRVERFSGD